MDDLAAALDTVWKSPESRLAVARRLVPLLGPKALLQLIAVDVAGLLGLAPNVIALDIATREIVLEGSKCIRIRVVDSGEHADIIYDEGVRVALDGTVERREARSLASAMAAAQAARDHSDAIAFLPADLRSKRLKSYADEFGFDVENFTQLAIAFPALQRAL